MSITVYPVTPDFAAEIGDVELSRPLAPQVEAQIKAALWKYAVLIFPGQTLTAGQHVDFARRFGPIESDSAQGREHTQTRLGESFADVSNLDHEGCIWEEKSRQRLFQLGNRLWHTDSSFKRVPSLCSLLHANSIPPVGGHTEFADLRAAYDALDDDLRTLLAGRVAEHSIFNSRARHGFSDFVAADCERLPPVPQAMVRTLPENGRKTLYVASHAGRVLGMDEAEGRALIDKLLAHGTQRRFVYTHRWRPQDLVLWDNRCTLHRGTAFDDLRHRRDMRRATVQDVANSCEQEGLEVPA